MDDPFSSEGLAAWRAHLISDQAFVEAAAGWNATILLRETGEPLPHRTTWVALDNGALSTLRPGTPADVDQAEFVLAADAATWQGLVDGSRDLAKAAFTGELRLERGSVLRLLPHARAAAALLRAARER